MVKRKKYHLNVVFIDRLHFPHGCDGGRNIALCELSSLGVSRRTRSEEDDIDSVFVNHLEFGLVLLYEFCVFNKRFLRNLGHRDQCLYRDAVHLADLLEVHVERFIINDRVCLALFKRVDDFLFRKAFVQRHHHSDVDDYSVICGQPCVGVRSDNNDPLTLEALADQISSDRIQIFPELVICDLDLVLSVRSLIDEAYILSVLICHKIHDLFEVLELYVVFTFILSHYSSLSNSSKLRIGRIVNLRPVPHSPIYNKAGILAMKLCPPKEFRNA